MRAIFLDRDGVICENRADHVKSWAEFSFLPGALDSLAALSRLGLPIVVVTNQAIVGRGITTAATVEKIHKNMVREITAYGGRIDRVIYCPHRLEDNCQCRKPNPGMLYQAAHEMGLNLAGSYMVGDAATDLVAGQQAGCRSFLVLTGRGFQQLSLSFRLASHQFTVSRDLLSATRQILKAEMNGFHKNEPFPGYVQPLERRLPVVSTV